MLNGGHDFTLIRADRLIDGSGSPPVERGAVLIDGDGIAAVGPEASVVPPEGARVEERVYEGMTVLPGLVDCHVHLNGMGDGRAGDELVTLPDEVLALQSARNARAHLYAGVTTVPGLRRQAADDVHAAAGDRDGHHRRADAGAHGQADGDNRRAPGLLRHRG